MNRKILTLALLISLPLQNAFSLGSAGIGTEILSVRSLSLAGSIQGPKHDPAFVYLNPALIGDGPSEIITGGMQYVRFSAERSGAGVAADEMITQSARVPNVAFTAPLADGKFGIGIAIVSPYGLKTGWKDTSSVRYVATTSSLETIDITPAISYRHNKHFAVGFGADYFLTDSTLEKKINGDAFNSQLGGGITGAPDIHAELDGDGEQWGYHTSVAVTPNDNNQFSVVYHSEVKTRINGFTYLDGLTLQGAGAFGGSRFRTRAFTDLFYPQNVQLGYMYSGEKWTFLANAAWYDWSANSEINIRNLAVSTLDTKIPLDWKDVWSFAGATSFRHTDNVSTNFGAYYLPSVTPDQTFSPLLPDLDRYGLTLGSTIDCNNVTFDFIYNPMFMKSRSITNNHGFNVTQVQGVSVNGDYKGMVHIVGANVSYKFGD